VPALADADQVPNRLSAWLGINAAAMLAFFLRTAAITIHEPHMVTGEAVPTHVIRQAETFIDRNRDVLLRFWNGEIDTGEMLDQIQKP
jgi:hypothetical protein